MGCGSSTAQKSGGGGGHPRAPTSRPKSRDTNDSRSDLSSRSSGNKRHGHDNEGQHRDDGNAADDLDDEYYGFEGSLVKPKSEPKPRETNPPPKEQTPPPPYEPIPPPKDPTPPPPKDPTPPPPKDPTPAPPKDPTPPPPKDPTPPPQPPEPTPPPPHDEETQPPPREATSPLPTEEAEPPPAEPTSPLPTEEAEPPPAEPTSLPPHEATPLPPTTPPPPRDPTPIEDDGEDDTPFDDDGVRDLEGYTMNQMGLLEKTMDFRREHNKDEDEKRPLGDPDNLYVDHEFPLEIAIVQDSDGIEWKRPKEFLEDPVLFVDDTTRFDIGQGSAGTCWFLSTVSNIAENESMIKQVIPDGSYRIDESSAYDGIFHGRFYHFGKWEDVYIDDFLPVIYGNVLWGAKSATEERELWVALLEKAFARLYGSYDAIYGGQPGDAYLLLTGGIGERIELEDHVDKPKTVYNRIQNALTAGCQVSCVVPDEYDDVYGLVGGHAYSLVGVAKVGGTRLIRVRNPWGHGEWKGPWSDGSEEWATIPDKAVTAPNRDDGEFFVSLDDFLTYFSQTTICSLTPDFDRDGCSDSLNHITNVYGEWAGPTAAGFHKLLQNPRYCFTVPEEGLMEDGFVPLVVQLIQHSEKRKTDNISIRCDVFRVLGDKITPESRCIALEIQGKKNNVYAPELQSSFRHKVKPGTYLVVPSTVDEGQEKAFLLRLFTPAPLQNVRPIPQDVDTVSCEFEDSIDVEGEVRKLTFERTLFGAFVSGKNAGGQVSHRDSYHLNPQYQITIPNSSDPVPLVVHIMQTYKEPQFPVGFRLYKMDQGSRLPVDIAYLYDHYQDCPADMSGHQSKFMISWDVDVRYLLPPGRYMGLVHLDEPDTEKSFAIVFKSTANVMIKGYQTG